LHYKTQVYIIKNELKNIIVDIYSIYNGTSIFTRTISIFP